ncbi:creatinine amidohydrolase/Fe(II)-dependent formamide hydrolase-like protein [Bradyrhizobium yuanmingense]
MARKTVRLWWPIWSGKASVFGRSAASLYPTGVYGYPSEASREKGENLLDAISRDLAEKICSKDLWALPWH